MPVSQSPTLSSIDLSGLPGRIYCLPVEQSELKSGLAVPFSMWQCGGHGDAAGSGFVH